MGVPKATESSHREGSVQAKQSIQVTPSLCLFCMISSFRICLVSYPGCMAPTLHLPPHIVQPGYEVRLCYEITGSNKKRWLRV